MPIADLAFPETPTHFLSAAAAEFVPQSQSDCKEPQRRSALGEITNVLANSAITKESSPKTKPQGRVLEIDTDAIFEDPPIIVLSPPGLEMCYEDPVAIKVDNETAGVSMHEDERAATGEALPSLGSAEHASGTCKRCNFFAKGRCQNGKACSFCHLSHEKRKPSRQEKRDRKAQENQTENHFEASYQVESCETDDVQQTLAYPIFPGMPPMQTTKLPAPLALPGTYFPGFASSPVAPPPGLLLQGCQVSSWQPEEEISPQALPASARTASLLSTLPSPSANFAGLSTTPAQTSLVPTPVASKIMVTMATQTDQDEAEDQGDSSSISREMLLKFRQLAGSCNSGIRAETW